MTSQNQLWRDAIAEQLQRADAGTREGEAPSEPSGEAARRETRPPTFAAQTEAYAHGQELLRHAEAQAMRWRDLMSWGRPAGATLALLVPMVAAFAVTRILGTEYADAVQWHFGNVPAHVLNGEWWRLVTALFLHANELHLLTNGLTLWIFGSAVEKTIGSWRALLIFCVAGVAGNLLSTTHGTYDVAIGASGAIFGFIGAFAVQVYRLRVPIYASSRRRLLMLLALTVAGDFSIGAVEPNLDNLAHVGGFFAGLALALMLDQNRRQSDAQMRGQPAGRVL